jgi:hypothetical protein
LQNWCRNGYYRLREGQHAFEVEILAAGSEAVEPLNRRRQRFFEVRRNAGRFEQGDQRAPGALQGRDRRAHAGEHNRAHPGIVHIAETASLNTLVDNQMMKEMFAKQ